MLGWNLGFFFGSYGPINHEQKCLDQWDNKGRLISPMTELEL